MRSSDIYLPAFVFFIMFINKLEHSVLFYDHFLSFQLNDDSKDSSVDIGHELLKKNAYSLYNRLF